MKHQWWKTSRAAWLGTFSLLFCITTPMAGQQPGTIRGTVTTRVTGQPLVAARVVLLGSNRSTRTNVDGEYTLRDVTAGPRGVQVFIPGYGSQSTTVTVGPGSTVEVNFELNTVAISIDEIVVTGTAGSARRREIGNSISTISQEDIALSPIVTLTEVLQGRSPSMLIQTSSGQVGSGPNIRLRGSNSVSLGNTPLVYVDGIRVRNTDFGNFPDEANQNAHPLNDINPQDIERVEIIKGAAATTLFGTEAAAGVIQIFTKRGTSGAPAWTFSMDQGTSWLGHFGPSKDINPTGLGVNDCSTLDVSRGNTILDPACPASGSYLHNGYEQRYNLSVRGGGESTNYFLSGKWASQQGNIQDQGTDDWALRGNFGFNPTETVTIQYNTSFAHRDVTWIPDGNNAEGFLLNVFRGDQGYTPGNNDSLVFAMGLRTAIDHFTTSAQVTWTPLSSFTHRLNVGIDWVNSEYTEDKPFGMYSVPLGNRENDTEQSRNLTADYASTWTRALLNDNVSSAFSFGAQLYERKTRRINGFGEDFAGPGDKDLDAGAITSVGETRRDVTSGGFFLQEVLGWQDRLFVTGGVRWDGFSTFGDDFGLASYPKLSAAYLLSEHLWWPGLFDSFKLRAAMGYSGKAPGIFDAERLWDAVSGDEAQPGVSPDNIGDPDLGPERTREFEVGAEASMFDGRMTVEYTYYDQKTTDALVGVEQVPSLGFIGRQLTNVGTITNRGHELTLDINVLPARNFNWDVGLTYSTNKSEAVDLAGQILSIGAESFLKEGFPVPGVFGPLLKNPDELGGALDRCTVPDNRTEFEEDPDACGFVGPAHPTWLYGLRTRLTIGRRLTIDALGEGQGGYFTYSGTAKQTVRRGTWPTCNVQVNGVGIRDKVLAGDISDLTVLQQAKCARTPNDVEWISPGDFFKLRHISMSYRLPSNWLPMFDNVTVRVAGRNLVTITNFEGLDPEAIEDGSGGQQGRRGYYNIPPSKQVVFSLKIDF